VFGTLARKLNTPYPIALVIGGLLLSFIPGIPKVTLNPDVVFLVIVPPLLYSAAWPTFQREFSHNLVSSLSPTTRTETSNASVIVVMSVTQPLVKFGQCDLA
jgi:hypothetical protein